MRSIALRLTLAFFAVSLSGILLVVLLAGYVTRAEFANFVDAQYQGEVVDALVAYYESVGNWGGIEAVRRGDGRPLVGPGSNLGLIDANGHVILPLTHPDGSLVTGSRRVIGRPIEVRGNLVGYLVSEPFRRPPVQPGRPTSVDFPTRVNALLVVATLGATGLSLLLGGMLARTLTRPLREMTAATQAVARGDLDQQVPVRSNDEIGTLAASFNQMNSALAESREQRRQMTADIAHELRTPLSLILGHAEALHDGVLPPTEDSLAVIHDEARRLSRLIDDLRTLSLADAGELTMSPRPVAPRVLLEQAALAHAPQAHQREVTLNVVADDVPTITADPDRLAQVMGNLIQNALRVSPTGSIVTLRASEQDGEVELQVQDEGPGIAPEALPHVFDRFYRTDSARRRQEGGSGLGLAIARSIVRAHNGRIWVTSSPGAGTLFHIRLPIGGVDGASGRE